MIDTSLIFVRMAHSDLHSLSCHPSLFPVSFSLLCGLDLSLSIQFLFFSPLSSADDPISAVLMRQMDSLPLNIHHMSHQNLPLLHFAPLKNEHPPPFFSKTIKVVCRVIRSAAGAASGMGSFYFYYLGSLTVKVKIDSERSAVLC